MREKGKTFAICDKTFSKDYDLKKHRCTICNKAFSMGYSLRKHIKTVNEGVRRKEIYVQNL